MNTSETHVFPIWTFTKAIIKTKQKNKSKCKFCSNSQNQDNKENVKNGFWNILYSLSFMWEIVLTKTIDNICVLNFVVDNINDKSADNDSINIDTNSDDNRETYNNINEYSNNSDGDTNTDDDNENIGDNSSNKNHNNYLRSDSQNNSCYFIRNSSTQTNSNIISNDVEFVNNITENITSAAENINATINYSEPQSTDTIKTIPLTTDEELTLIPTSQFKSFVQNNITQEENTSAEPEAIENPTLLPTSQFKSFVPNINTQEDIDDALCLPFSYQSMFDKRTSPWEMKDWDHDELNNFVIEPENIDRLYHMVADDEDQNFRSWEICCRMDYKGEKYFVEMYANCDYTGFDCQGGGHVSITKLPDFFLENMVTMDQNPDQIYKSLREDGYNVQEPDLLHKVHPKFWNNAPMLKYLCHNAIYKHRDVLPHFKDQLPKILANSVDEFIKVKDWDNE